MWMLISVALGADVRLDVSWPGHPSVICSASDVQQGELLEGPSRRLGEASVTPLLEVTGVDAVGRVHWRTALHVVQSGLISIARTDDRQDPSPCQVGSVCQVTFNRAEQTTQLSVTFTGDLLTEASERRTWSTQAWFREGRPMACSSEERGG